MIIDCTFSLECILYNKDDRNHLTQSIRIIAELTILIQPGAFTA